jgi:hypothetical protein
LLFVLTLPLPNSPSSKYVTPSQSFISLHQEFHQHFSPVITYIAACSFPSETDIKINPPR